MAEQSERVLFGVGCRLHVTIEDLIHGGDGLARVKGKVIFVPFAIQNEQVEIEIVSEKRDYARGKILSILKESPFRIKPKCRHFGICGGCQLQHVAYEEQLRAKARWVREKIDRLQTEKIIWGDIQAAQNPWHYRDRIQLHRSSDGTWGFHQSNSHEVVAIEQCPITRPELLEQTLRKAKQNPKMDRLEGTWGEQAGSIDRNILGFKLRSSPESFLQVNAEQNLRLVETVLNFAGVNPQGVIWDLYAGGGNFSVPLANTCKLIFSVESSKESSADARHNAKVNQIANMICLNGEVKKIWTELTRQSPQPDLIVLDPPRAGAKEILALIPKPARLIYVSCDPASLARDCKELMAMGYRVIKGQVIDLFPQTQHVETILLLET